jgi:UDP-N-acetylglucosamine acyltransferase
MRRRGFKRDDIHRARRFYRDLFLGDGDFARRLAAVGPDSQDDPLLGRIIAFIRARKKRPLLMARAGAADESADAP